MQLIAQMYNRAKGDPRHAMLRRMLRRLCALSFVLLLIVAPLRARVTRVEIASRTDVLGGKSFGEAGAYERITGRIYFSLPIANPHNQRIVDLSNAVNLKDGEVEFSADFTAVRPKSPDKGNGSLLLEVPNRGRSRILSLVDGGDEDLATSAGDAWLLRNGFTIVALGWQWDAAGPHALRFFAPVAKENGKTITGLLRGDVMPRKDDAGYSARTPHGRQYRRKRIPCLRTRRSAQCPHRP